MEAPFNTTKQPSSYPYLTGVQYHEAQLVHLPKLVIEAGFQLLGLGLCQLILAKVKDLLRQQPQDGHGVLAQRLVGFAGAYNVRDEGRPLVGPVLLQDVNQHEVEFVEVGLFSPKCCLIGGNLNDEVADVGLDAFPLSIRKRAPSTLDHAF
jgi:hypothetical protein